LDSSPEPTVRGGASPDRSGLVIAGAVLVALAGFGVYLSTLSAPDVPDLGEAGHVLPVPLELSRFELVDQRGQPFDRSRLEGRWSLLFFGYSYCPDVCPMTLQTLARVREHMDADAETQIVFVSVDPERDTPERLAEYVAFFDPAMLGVTGEIGEVMELSRSAGAFHQKAEGENGDEYLVDHTTSLFLVGPEAYVHAILHEPEDPQAFVDLLKQLRTIERSSG
jgi:protein SCO1/2